jgi:hypothetical protein
MIAARAKATAPILGWAGRLTVADWRFEMGMWDVGWGDVPHDIIFEDDEDNQNCRRLLSSLRSMVLWISDNVNQGMGVCM